jgi:hypothetical protein
MTEKDYQSFRSGATELSLLGLSRVANYLDLNLENLMDGKIDYKAISARFQGDSFYIPESYSENGFSRRRTAVNLLDAAEEFLGWQARVSALKYLQTSETALRDLDATINLQFQVDLCNYLQRKYRCDDTFFAMGAYSVVTNHKTEFGKRMAAQKRVSTIYQFFIEEFLSNHWEKNYHYRLTKLTDTSCQIEAVPNPDAMTQAGRYPGSALICQTKAGVSACVPGYLGLPFAHVREIKCVHRGDSSCVQEVDFEMPAYQMRRRTRVAAAEMI